MTWFGYNNCIAQHYTIIIKLVVDFEPETFAKAAHDLLWVKAIDAKMQRCKLSKTMRHGTSSNLYHTRRPLVVDGSTR